VSDDRFGTIGFVKYETAPMPHGMAGLFAGRIDGDREHWTFAFPNGYGASVITGWGAYGTPEQPYELAVLHGESLCYATPLTDDVIGYLNEDGVKELLDDIAILPEKPDCTHEHKEDDE